jgi:hypothetical protein
MPSKGETALFQSYPPRRDLCALCECRQGPFTFEPRPTGRDGAIQSWPYCAGCWRACQALTVADPLGYRALLYVIFERDPRACRPDMVG